MGNMKSISFLALAACLCFCQASFAYNNEVEPQVIRVGVYENPPKVMFENGQVSGIFGDILQEMAFREGWKIEPITCQWNDCLKLLRSGDIDLMPDVALNQQRDESFIFHQTPVLHSWSQLYGKRSLKVSSLLDLEGVRIAVLEDSIQQVYLADIATNFGLQVEFVAVRSFEQGFQAVLANQADVVASNHLYGDRRARELDLEPTPVMFQPSRLYFVSGNTQLQSVINTIETYISDWRGDAHSPFYQILQRWRAMPSDAPAFPYALITLLGSVLLLVFATVLWLRRRVKQRTLELAHSELKLNTILDSVEAYIYIKDKNLRYEYANKKVCDYLGTTTDKIIGQSDSAFFNKKTCEHLMENDLRVIRQGERVADEENNVTADGSMRHFLSVKIPLRNAYGEVYALCGISTDITEHITIKESLTQLEYYDAITGLANRKLLLQNLEHALASSNRTGYEGALVSIDLTHFTIINDTLGHAAGDQVLQQVAQRIRSSIDDTDTAARLGSDDFVVILEDLSRDPEQAVLAARNWARELLAALAEPYVLGDITHSTTACIGVTMFSDSQSSVAGLLKNADLAIAEAKAQGAESIRFFNPAMQESINRRMLIESALRRAVKNNELELYMQPQVNEDREVIAGELLLRWTDPDLGVISPVEFIPVAESSGLIVPLGSWVIEQACSILQQWQAHDALKHIPLAVNISPRQFRHSHFVTHIERCLQAMQIPPGLLELEITEGLLIDNIDITVKRLVRLGELGVRFSLDDFGTGYASLAYLKKLPLYQLKIDQSFVRDMLTDVNDEVITTTILGLGKNLNLSVIAEGVETQAQLEHLRGLGCHKFQGYLFGRPQPISYWQSRLEQSKILPEDASA